jgi:hypothetical protein
MTRFRSMSPRAASWTLLFWLFLLPAIGLTQEVTPSSIESALQPAVDDVATGVPDDIAVQAEQAAVRPNAERGPTRVRFLVLVIDIDSIDAADQNFTANVYVRLRWRDERLANPGAPVRRVSLESVWNPRIVLANVTGMMWKSLPDVVQIDEYGVVTYHQRYTGKLSQALRLAQFPRDRHTFDIHFIATGYNDDELHFIPDTHPSDPSLRGGTIADAFSLPDWRILGYEARALSYTPVAAVRAAGFALSFHAERYMNYYVWQIVLPLSVVVMMSWSAFWLSRSDVGVRIGIATSSVLTMITFRFILATLLPRLPYMTRMDYLTVGSTVLVLVSLLTVVMVTFLTSRNHQGAARAIDLWSRGLFPLAFLSLLAWFLLARA